MTFSVNTNTGAMTALQYLNQTESQLATTQSAINSGLKVADARDNGAIFAIAQNQRAAVAGYTAVTNSINNGTSSIDVALSAGQSISDLLIQMKQQALSAADTSLDTASRQSLNADFQALLGQITTIVQNATFNNSNLINGSTTKIMALASADGSRHITTQAQNMSLLPLSPRSRPHSPMSTRLWPNCRPAQRSSRSRRLLLRNCPILSQLVSAIWWTPTWRTKALSSSRCRSSSSSVFRRCRSPTRRRRPFCLCSKTPKARLPDGAKAPPGPIVLATARMRRHPEAMGS